MQVAYHDVWRERDSFALEASGGAPHDAVFTRGQNWRFPPLRPEGIRENGYRYFIRCLRFQLAHAGTRRIDHVMSLHRLYWIPAGFEAYRGAYARYPAEEFYATHSLESHRHRASLAGENPGTVPSSVDSVMSRYGIQQMYVVQYELAPETDALLPRACLALLAASPARLVIVNLEDRWQEMDPQSVPGTGNQRLNWRKKARYSFGVFSRMPLVLDLLGEISRWREARPRMTGN